MTGISQVPYELNDLTEDEKRELVGLVRNELDFTDNVEEIIGMCLLIADDIKKLIEKF